MMRVLVVLLQLTVCVLAARDYVDDEFVLRLEKHVALDEFVDALSRYDIKVKETHEFPSGTVLLVEGEARGVNVATRRRGVLSVGRNRIYSIDQSCSSQPCPEVWGLDRIDQMDILDYTDPTWPMSEYEWGVDNGEGVYAYVVDTGIAINDTEFSGRAIYGFSAIDDIPFPEDDNGHGTHVSGTIGSESYGIAKDCTLVAVKVMSRLGFGTTIDIVEGLGWVLTDHQARGTDARSVVNMSIGGAGADDNIEGAVRDLVNGGVTVVVAAGNSNNDACNYTPAREPLAITVGATNIDDESARFSNWGPCLDIFAPGVRIKSTWINNNTRVIDGTSMACPHVVGVVTRFMSSTDSPPSPAMVDTWLKDNGTPDVLNLTFPGHDTGPNLMVYSPCVLP